MKIFALSVIIVALICTGLVLKSCRDKPLKQVQQIATHQSDSTRYYRDLWGAEHANRLLVEGDRKVIQALYQSRIDSVCRRLGLREKQIQDMASVIATDAGSFTAPVQPDTMTIHDTLREGLAFKWNDDYLHMAGFVDSSSAYVSYDIEIPINLTTYWKRRWLLGRKRYYIDGYSNNPRVHLAGLSGIKIN